MSIPILFRAKAKSDPTRWVYGTPVIAGSGFWMFPNKPPYMTSPFLPNTLSMYVGAMGFVSESHKRRKGDKSVPLFTGDVVSILDSEDPDVRVNGVVVFHKYFTCFMVKSSESRYHYIDKSESEQTVKYLGHMTDKALMKSLGISALLDEDHIALELHYSFEEGVKIVDQISAQ